MLFLHPQLVDLVVDAAIDHVLRAIAFPGKADGIAARLRAAGYGAERAAILPLSAQQFLAEPQLVNVAFQAAIEDMLGLVAFPREAKRIAGGGLAAGFGADSAAVLPLGIQQALGKP